jgi:hypothetical protein
LDLFSKKLGIIFVLYDKGITFAAAFGSRGFGYRD